MKRHLFFFLVLLLTSGWNWKTHTAFVESVYYSLDNTVAAELNLSALEQGAIAPDKEFHDQTHHHYPFTVNLSAYWLGKAKEAYGKGEYQEASFAFGVATHYISDTYAAPHNVVKEPPKLHSEYEAQGSSTYFVTRCTNRTAVQDLPKTLLAATAVAKTWEPWVKTKDITYPEEAVKKAMGSIYVLAEETFQTKCREKTTSYEKGGWFELSPLTLVLVAVILYVLLTLSYSLMKGE